MVDQVAVQGHKVQLKELVLLIKVEMAVMDLLVLPQAAVVAAVQIPQVQMVHPVQLVVLVVMGLQVLLQVHQLLMAVAVAAVDM
jgi:hypothetical protein